MGAVGPAHEVPAQARDVRLEAGRIGEAGTLDFLERERGRKTQRHIVAGKTFLNGFGDRVGGERRAGVGLELRGGLRRGAPVLEGFLERGIATQGVHVLWRVFAREDAGADDLLLVVERHEHVARAGVAQDAVGVGRGRDQAPEAVTGLVLDEERLVGSRLQPLGTGEERLGVIEPQTRQRGLREGSRALQEQGGEEQSRETPAFDQPGADAG